jgi:hypothetical protein
MIKTRGGLLRTVATRAVIAAIPAAMVSAYAGGLFISPPRTASYEIAMVAEITADPTTVGIAASNLYGMSAADINAQLDQMQAIGVQSIRVFVPWGLVEPLDNTYYWDAIDAVVSAAAARNMGVMAEINGTPVWNNATLPLGSGTPDPDKFADFMKALVSRTTAGGVSYANTISAYEIWNEPNGVLFSNPVDPVAYAHLLETVYPIIKGLDPSATVVAGALGHVFTVDGYTMDPVEFVQAMLDAGAGGSFDALSYHPYDETAPFSDGDINAPWASDTAYNQIKDIQALIGNRLVWLSEYGVPTTDGTAEEEAKQAAYIKNLLDTWYALGEAGGHVGPVFLYTGQDDLPVGASTDPNNYFGLWYKSGACTATGCAKDAVAILQKWLADHPQTPTGPTDPTHPTNPTDPAAALQAALQAFAQQVANAISQAFAGELGQQIVNAIVDAISNALAGLGQQAAPAAAPLAMKMASAESTDATLAATADSEVAGTEEATATDGAKTDTAATETETETSATDVTPAEAAAEPAVTKPEATGPAEPTTPADTATPGTPTETGAAGTPSVSTTSAGSPTDGEAGGSGSAGKPGDTGKAGDADKPGKSEGPGRDGRDGKDGKDGPTKSGTHSGHQHGDHQGAAGRHDRGGKRGVSDSEGKVRAEGTTAGHEKASASTAGAAG